MPSRPQTPAVAARSAGLRYVTDSEPGIVRMRAGRGFRYRTARGRPVRDRATLARIRALAIPPAWERVWICPSPHGHIQATGRDARGRKQYRYHPRWTETRDESKYGRLLAFGHALRKIRQRARRDQRAPRLSRPHVLATVLRLLETTSMRVGNEEYARANGSYGLTTLKDRHVRVRGAKMRFHFRAKSGVLQTIDLENAALARSVKECQDLPGQTLFQYLDEHGRRVSLGSSDVNAYLREISGEEFTAKDFRTWAGTVLAACTLRTIAAQHDATGASERQRKRDVIEAIDEVAARLGNTRAVCRRCYVHPHVLDEYLVGRTIGLAIDDAGRRAPAAAALSPDERAVLKLLARRARMRPSSSRAASTSAALRRAA